MIHFWLHDHNDNLMYHFFALQHAFHRCLFDVLATHVTVCVCSHAESKGNFFPYLLIYLLTYEFATFLNSDCCFSSSPTESG